MKIRQKFSILKVRLNCFIFTPKFHDLHGNELFHTNTFETFLDTFQPNFADILEFSPETQDKTNYESCKKKKSDKFYQILFRIYFWICRKQCCQLLCIYLKYPISKSEFWKIFNFQNFSEIVKFASMRIFLFQNIFLPAGNTAKKVWLYRYIGR